MSITFKDCKVQLSNSTISRLRRIDQSPGVMNVYIVPPESDTPPIGVGEPGVPFFAPTLINAIFAATGKRIGTLPIGNSLKQGNVTLARRFSGLRGDGPMKPNSTALAVPLLSRCFSSMHSRRLLKQRRCRARPQRHRQRRSRAKPRFPTKARPPRRIRTAGEASCDSLVKQVNEDEKRKA